MKVFIQDGKFYCDNIDLKSTPEGLNKNLMSIYMEENLKK